MGDFRRFEVFRNKRCLVTGGAGAIGSELVRTLVNLGADVTVLDDLSSGHLENLAPVLPKIRMIRGSVAARQDINAAYLNEPQFVFHLAAHFANQNSIEHPESDMMTNVVGTQMMLERARADKALEGLVYSSSSCVLGGFSSVMTETTLPAPETPYGVSKLAGEHYTLVYAEVYKLRASVVRYFNVFGPGEFPGRYRNVIPNFLHRAHHNQPLTITGDGTESREFVCISDAVRGTMLAAITPGARGQVFHLGSGNVLQIRDLAERILAVTGSRSRIQYQPRRSWDLVSRRETSRDKARAILGFQAEQDFEVELRRTYDWLMQMEAEYGCLAPEMLPVASVPAIAAAAAAR